MGMLNLCISLIKKLKFTLMAEWLMYVVRVLEFQILDMPNLTQSCKQFGTASTSMQIAVLPWCYDTELGTTNSSHASA